MMDLAFTGLRQRLGQYHIDNLSPGISSQDVAASSKLYSQLNRRKREFRLLKLHPGVAQQEIRASLVVSRVALVSQTRSRIFSRRTKWHSQYEAISYCWGDPRQRTAVRLNKQTIEVPISAVEALRQFRLHDRDRLLWIDAVCINQSDIDERSSQVAMMGDIYTSSAQTLVYMNTDADTFRVKKAFELMERIREGFLQQEGTSWIPSFYASKGNKGMKERAQLVVLRDDDNLGLLNVVFENPWFSRLWVWQEVLLASKCRVNMKSSSTSWDTIVATAIWSGHTGHGLAPHWSPPTPEERLPTYLSRLNMMLPSTLHLSDLIADRPGRPGYTLGYLLSITEHRQTTDPRDRVYALLGLALEPGKEIPATIRPNYRKSTRDCMRDATRIAIADSGTLNVLSDQRLNAKTELSAGDAEYPSWVPVWSCDSSRFLMSSLHGGIFTADNNKALKKALASDDRDPDVLLLTGFVVSSVTNVQRPTEETFESIEHLQQFLERVNSLITPHRPRLSLAELVLILLAETLEGDRVTLADERIKSFDMILDGMEREAPAAYRVRYDSSYVLQRLIYQCRGKALFTTDDHRFGKGLASIEVDDSVTVLYGGDWPFVLRRVENHFRLVGHCFIEGIMDGEAMEEYDRLGSEPVTFEIR